MDIQGKLFALQDTKYRSFHQKLMPTVDPDRIIGIRTPDIRKLAKELYGSAEAEEFISVLPHKYYEENNLHGFLIENIKDFDACLKEIERFLPYVDNWATCDSIKPRVFTKNPDKLLAHIHVWIASGRTYTVRYGIGCLMNYYLGDSFDISYVSAVAAVKCDEYYVKMMVAWYFATALAKQYDAVLPFIEKQILEPQTHNKAIQKAVESYRMKDEQKQYLKTLKIK